MRRPHTHLVGTFEEEDMSSTGQDGTHRRGFFRALTWVVAIGAIGAGGLAWAGHMGKGPLGSGVHGRFAERFARLHVELATERAMRSVKATPEQREKVDAILDKAFADHQRFRQQHEALRSEALEVLGAETVDRERLESLRARHLQVAEEGSKHLTAVIADIADVLTPAQRQKLAAHASEMLE
jgi:protein CpxP